MIFLFNDAFEVEADALAEQFQVGVHQGEHLGLVKMLADAHVVDRTVVTVFREVLKALVEQFVQLLSDTLLIFFICHTRVIQNGKAQA